MINFPQQYAVIASGPSGIDRRWETQGPAGIPLQAAIPEEFDGPGGGFSPEELYALALTNCFVATFKVVAEKSRLDFDTVKAEGKLIVDVGENKHPWMARIELAIHLTGVDDAEKAERVLQKASKSCLILNSVKTEKALSWTIE